MIRPSRTRADRMAIVVEVVTSRIAGVPPLSAEAIPRLSRDLAEIETRRR